MKIQFPEKVDREITEFPMHDTWLITGLPKSGKSTLAAAFSDKTLVLDTQGGYRGVSGAVIDLQAEARKQKTSPLEVLRHIVPRIPDEYDAVVLDVMTDLSLWTEKDVCEQLGASGINEGKAGYGVGYERQKGLVIRIVDVLQAMGKTTILVFHTTPDDEDTSALHRTLECPKKVRPWITGVVDHMAYCFREGGQHWCSFGGFAVKDKAGVSEVTGSRHKQLQGRKFEMPEHDPWQKIKEAYEQ